MHGGPLLAVLAEFEDDLATEDAYGVLGYIGHVLNQSVPVAPVTMAEGIVLSVGRFMWTMLFTT